MGLLRFARNDTPDRGEEKERGASAPPKRPMASGWGVQGIEAAMFSTSNLDLNVE